METFSAKNAEKMPMQRVGWSLSGDCYRISCSAMDDTSESFLHRRNRLNGGFSAERVTWLTSTVLSFGNVPLDLTVSIVRVQGVVAGRVREIAQLVQVLLPFPNVPVKAFGQRIEPVRDLVDRANTRHRVHGGGYLQAERLNTISFFNDDSPIRSDRLLRSSGIKRKLISIKAYFAKR